jgi:predicted dienelactone hydrolase
LTRRRILIGVGFALLVLSVLCVGVMVPIRVAAVRSAAHPDTLPYAVPGPHPVGMRSLATAGEAPLEMTMWYPASNGENLRAKTTYSYEMKMGAPLGNVTFATYAGQAIQDAPYDLSMGPYPLVVLSPGFSIGSSTYAWLAEHLASYGFVVIAPEHQEQLDEELNGLWQTIITRPQDILALLAYVDEQVGPGRALEGLVDAETVAVIGHSQGGYTTLVAGGAQIDTDSFEALCETAYESNDPNAWLCDELLPHIADMAELAGLDSVPEGLWQQAWSDPRVDAIVPMAGDAFFLGQDGLAEITVPVMAIGGTRDSDAPYMWGTYPTYEYASSTTKARVALVDAEHMIFTGPCEAIPLLLRFVSNEFCADPGWDRVYAHSLVRHFTTAFLLAVLKQDADAAAALAPDAVEFPGVTYEAQGY